MKGLFIPGITAEMFRNGCLESIDALMAEGEIYDIEYEPCGDCISLSTTDSTTDCISRQAAEEKLKRVVDEMALIFADIREKNVDDSVCGLCEYDCDHGIDGCANECPGFERDDCFKLKEEYQKEWTDLSDIPSVEPEKCGDCMTVEEYRAKLIETFHKTDHDELIALVVLPIEKDFEHLEWLLKTHYGNREKCNDCISRQAAKLKVARVTWKDGDSCYDFHDRCVDCLDDVPPAQPEKCGDCISRQAAIDTITHELSCGAVVDQCGLETAYDLIKDLPSVTPARPKGKWIPMQVSSGRDSWKCSECGRRARGRIENLPYCHCGAKMEDKKWK